jgi:hypothetical protein
MGTVIDSLVVTLGLDPKAFKAGSAQARTDLKLTSDEAQKRAREMEASGKVAAQYFSKIRNEALALLGVFTAGVGIKNFVENTIVGAASLGRLSQNLGISTERLSAWQRVAEDAGGTAEGMAAQLKESQKTIAQFRMGQSSESLQWFFRMGGKTSDLKDGNTYLMARSKIISEIFKNDPGRAQLVASQMGISDDQFNLLKQGPSAVQAQVAAMEKLSAISADDARQADELRKKWLGVERTFTLVGIKVVEALMPAFDTLIVYIKQLGDWVVTHKDDITNWVNGAVKSIQDFAKEANKAADAVGGWQNVLIGLAAIKVLGMVSPLLSLAGALNGVGGGLARIALSGPGALIALGFLAEQIRKNSFEKAIPPGPNHDQYVAEAQAGGVVTPDVAQPPPGGFGKLGQWWNGKKTPTEVPRGIRNNNPGNIRYGDFAYRMGATGRDSGGFAIFPTMAAGTAAEDALLRTYVARGDDTVRKIISKYAPASENDTGAYIAQVTKKLGVGPDQKLSSAHLSEVAKAIYAQENGAKYADPMAAANIPVGAIVSARPVTSNTSSSEVNINGPINVHTHATDAAGVARSLGSEISKYHFVAQANTGLT